MKSRIFGVGFLGWINKGVEGAVYVVPDEKQPRQTKQAWLSLCSSCALYQNLCTGMVLNPKSPIVPFAGVLHANPQALLNRNWYRKNITDPSECDVPPLPEGVTENMLSGKNVFDNSSRN